MKQRPSREIVQRPSLGTDGRWATLDAQLVEKPSVGTGGRWTSQSRGLARTTTGELVPQSTQRVEVVYVRVPVPVERRPFWTPGRKIAAACVAVAVVLAGLGVAAYLIVSTAVSAGTWVAEHGAALLGFLAFVGIILFAVTRVGGGGGCEGIHVKH